MTAHLFDISQPSDLEDLPMLEEVPLTPAEQAAREAWGVLALAFIAGASVGCGVVLHFVPMIWRLL